MMWEMLWLYITWLPFPLRLIFRPHLRWEPFSHRKKQPQKTNDINWSLKTLTRYCEFFKWAPFKCLPLLSPKNLLQSPTPVCGWSVCNWHFWISIVPQRSNGLNVSKSVQKCPMCPKVLWKSIHHIRHSFVELYVLKSVFPGRCGWPK